MDRPTIEKMLGRYKDSLLLLRGETIARTEALSSLHQAQNEAFRQAVDTGNIAQQDIRRIWRTARDERVRHSHRMLEGESVGLEERFSNGLMFPGDPDGPASETIMCRCYIEARIDFLSNIR